MAGESEQDLLGRAYQMLRELLADGEGGVALEQHPANLPNGGRDAAWEVSAAGHGCPLLVQAHRRFVPRDVDRVLGGVAPLMQMVVGKPPVIVVAPWLSPRSRELLSQRSLNYIDLTGNIRLNVSRPAIRLRLEGAQHDPNPPAKRSVRLQGAGVHALVRILVDVEPPYRMIEEPLEVRA